MERFWQKVDRNGPTPISRPDLGRCWLWTAYCNDDGYGKFRIEGRSRYAHQVSFELCIGVIPVSREVDHLCRVHNCVNPSHLEAVTRRENIMRGIGPAKTTARQLAKTNCPRGHEYAGSNLYVSSRGDRQCRTCLRESQRRVRAKRGATA